MLESRKSNISAAPSAGKGNFPLFGTNYVAHEKHTYDHLLAICPPGRIGYNGVVKMVMSWIFTGLLALSLFASFALGNGSALAAAVPQGARDGVNLVLSIAGSICLWSGVGKLMDTVGFTGFLAKILSPLLHRLFPSTKQDAALGQSLSANVCANFLGLGNAATPMGIQAAQRLARRSEGIASDELCRLIVLNTASIQLIPANVAAVRVSLGCQTPFDILPAVWVTSLCSAGLGLLSAWILGKVWRR